MQMNELPVPEAIKKDYMILHEYAIEAATCCPDNLRRKRFVKSCPEKTIETMKVWGRDRWIMFDTLPLTFREMINNDEGRPDDILPVVWELWMEIESKAVAAMDRILKYESAVAAVEDLPAWLQGDGNEILDIIRELRVARLELLRQQLAEAEERRKEQERLRAKQKPTTRYIPATRMEDWRVKQNGQWEKLEKLKGEIVALKLPPHLERAMMVEKLEIKRVEYTRPAGFYTHDPHKAADKADREAPLKFHPKNFSFGKNS